MDNEYELLKCLDNITEELKRIADFLVASKVVPEKRESTIKKVSAGEKDLIGLENVAGDKKNIPPITSKSAEPKEKDMVLRDIEFKPYEGKSYLVKREDGKVAFIGKSLVKSIDEGLGKITFKPSQWFTLAKIEWKEDKY